jgi:hypothetical protein
MFEVPIAADDSCGVMPCMARTDLRIFNRNTDADVTNLFSDVTTCVDADLLVDAITWCKKNSQP